MVLLVIAILAIAGLTTTIGLLIFHVISLISNKRTLLSNIAISLLAAIVIVINLSLVHSSALTNLFKHFIFYSIILNYLLVALFVRKLYLDKNEYFPGKKNPITRGNVIALILYGVILALYLFFSIHGLHVGWEEITS